MAQYKQPDITNVFWASNEGFKGGRDPLGIQNSSIATYSILLPGLTNLTRHIRYYSLYCWLLSEYDELEKNGNASVHQYNFIRRAELAMAFIMKDQGIGAIVGALYISQMRYKSPRKDVYELADGADYNSKDRYWTFKTGALGQYYLGSLIYYELIKVEEGRFYLRNKGKELANALRNSVKRSVRELFIECIKKGCISENEIKAMQPLAIHRIAMNSEEWIYLNHLMTKTDDGSSFRKETVYLLLQDLDNGETIEDFARNRFLHVNDESRIGASFGWYFYYLCECLHYSIDSIFCLVLNMMHDLHNPPMQELSQEIVESILLELKKEQKFKTVEEWKKCVTNDIVTLYDQLRNAIWDQEYIQAAVYSLRLLLRLHNEFEKNDKAILDFENINDLRRQHGILSEGLKVYVSQYLSWSIPKYIKNLVSQIMQEHTFIAIGKMGNKNSDLRKFILEDGRAVLVEIRYPVETSPRLTSLFNYLQDLNYLDVNRNNELTEIAYKYIRDYGKE